MHQIPQFPLPPHSAPLGALIAYAGPIGEPDENGNLGFPQNAGWLPCDGRLLEGRRYPELFSLLGTTYGSDPQVESSFNIPQLTGLFPNQQSTDPKTQAATITYLIKFTN